MRRIALFECEAHPLVGTVDEAAGASGVLIVSGGNEIRSGAHRGMAILAQMLADHGVPVFRFDRRGIGDSCGGNGGWASAAPDIAAAAAAFRAEQPLLRRIIGFGNCDAATALALFGRAAGIDALVLANPWLGDDDALPPPAAIRARYAARLRDPAEWLRLVRGRVDFRKLVSGLRKAAAAPREQPLATQFALAVRDLPLTLVLATGDRTAQNFTACWRGPGFAAVQLHARTIEIDTASHSFVGDAAALERAILAAVTT